MAKPSPKAVTHEMWGRDLSMHHRLKNALEAMIRNKGGTDRSWGAARAELIPLREADFPEEYQADFLALMDEWSKAIHLAGKTRFLLSSTLSPRQRDHITSRLLRLFTAHSEARGKYFE